MGLRCGRPVPSLFHAERVRSTVAAGALVSALVVGGSLSLVAPAAAQDTATLPTTAAAAPADALAYLSIPLVEDSEQWVLTVDLLERAGLGEEFATSVQNELEGAPLDAFLGGEAGVIVTQAAVEAAAAAGAAAAGGGFVPMPDPDASPAATDGPAVPQATGVAVALDARAPDTAYAGLLSAIEDQATQAGVVVEETDYQGTTISSAPADPTEEDGLPLAAARVDDLILVATAPKDLEPAIDALTGGAAPLTNEAAFADVVAALPADYLLLGYVNEAAAVEAQAAVAVASGMSLPLDTDAAGRHSGFVVRADQPGFRLETVTLAEAGAELPPAPSGFESDLLARTPADALFFFSASELGATNVLQGLGAVGISLALGQFGGMATPTPDESADAFIARQYQELASLIGVNLQTDLLDQLSGEYGAWVRADPAAGAVEALFASGVTDPGVVVNALSQLALLVQGGGGGETVVTTRTVDGSTVNVIETEPGAPPIEYGVVGDRLLIGVGDAIDTDADGPAAALADAGPYQDAVAALPDVNAYATVYVDLAQVVPLLAGAADSSDGMGMGLGAEDGGEDASESCADFASQEEAQAAYDANEPGTFDLDQDFDGIVCEDYFGASTPTAGAAGDQSAAGVPVDLSAFTAFALVAYEEDGMRRSSAIVTIAE